jgi:hypothetical protein
VAGTVAGARLPLHSKVQLWSPIPSDMPDAHLTLLRILSFSLQSKHYP